MRWIVVGLFFVCACGSAPPPPPAPQPAGGAPRESGSGGPQIDEKQIERAQGVIRDALDKQEKVVLGHAFNVALGTDPEPRNYPAASVSKLVGSLRTKGVKIRLRTKTQTQTQKYMLDGDGMRLDYKHDKPSMPTPAFRETSREIDALEAQILLAYNVALDTNTGVLKFGEAVMTNVARLYAERRKANQDLTTGDYQRIAKLLAFQKRAETQAAIATSFLVAYQAVIRDGKDPKAIESYATDTPKAFPIETSATEDEARAYFDSFKKDLPGSKERYFAMTKAMYSAMRGEEQVDDYKRHVDETFDNIEKLLATAPAPQGGAKLTTASAAAAAGGDPMKTLDAMGERATPLYGKAKTAVQGVMALSKGDYKGAISAASELMAPGPLKSGLSIVSSLFK
jgi:hypothetical protein